MAEAVLEFLIMNLSTFLVGKKKKFIVNSINIFSLINILHILVIFKWLNGYIPLGCLDGPCVAFPLRLGTWHIPSFVFPLVF